MAQPEGLLCKKITVAVEKRFKCCELNKTHGSPMGKLMLDLRGSVCGHAVEIEVKMPGNEPSPRQLQRIRHLKQLRVISGWCTSVQEAIDIITEGLQCRSCPELCKDGEVGKQTPMRCANGKEAGTQASRAG